MDSTEAREEDPPAIKSADEGRQEAAEISSAILDAGIRGEVTEPGPGVSDCPGNDRATGNDRLFLMRHPWSIYGLPTAKLEEGLDNLRRELPRQGWEIIEDRRADSPDRQPVVLFENRTLEYAAHVSLIGPDSDDPRLHVSLVSACFSTPGHESAKNEH